MKVATIFFIVIYSVSVCSGVDKREDSLSDKLSKLKSLISKVDNELKSKVADLKSKILLKDLKSSGFPLFRTASTDTGQSLQKRALAPHTPIAFYATLTKDLTTQADHQGVIFDNVITNIGNTYNNTSGYFKAPTAGVYAFAWSNTNRDHSFMNTELVANAVVQGKAMSDAYDHNDYAIATNIALLDLRQGDTVYVRSGMWHSGHIAGDMYSTFSGWLIDFI